MPTYHHACPVCGGFALIRPMAEADVPVSCPDCGRDARRIFHAPAVRSLSPGLRRALDAQQRSADSPQVVTSVPAEGRRRRTQARVTDPRQARLPRP